MRVLRTENSYSDLKFPIVIMRRTVIFSDNSPVVAVLVIAILFVLRIELEMGFMFWSTNNTSLLITYSTSLVVNQSDFQVTVENPVPSNYSDQSRQEQIAR